MCLFHDGKVSTEVGIKYFIKADSAQSSGHLSFYVGTDRVTKFFAKSGTNSRSGLYDHVLGRICDCSQNIVDLGLLLKSTGRADCDTLTTGYTAGLTQSHIKCGTNEGCESTLVRTDYADALNFLTHCGAAAAQDTFAVVADHMYCTVIDAGWGTSAIIVAFVLNAKFFCKLLQFAVTAAYAG